MIKFDKSNIPNITIGLQVTIKATGKHGKVTDKKDGFWVVEFPNGLTSKYATYQLMPKR